MLISFLPFFSLLILLNSSFSFTRTVLTDNLNTHFFWRNYKSENIKCLSCISGSLLLLNTFTTKIFRRSVENLLTGCSGKNMFFLLCNTWLGALHTFKKQSLADVFQNICILEILQYSQENTCAGVSFCNSITKKFQHTCFPVNIAKCLRTTFL